jgi:hypothetical protein
VSWVSARPAAAQPLPEGDTGIAAQYPNDVGINNHPDVVLTEDFESAPEGPLPWQQPWDNVWGNVMVIRNAAYAHSGQQAIEITHTQPGSQGCWKDFGQNGFDTLHMRYYMKYHPLFPGCHHTGGIIFAGAPGVDIATSTGVPPDGTNHFTAALDDLPPYFSWSPAGNSPPGFANIYCYHMDQAGNYGDVFFPSGLVLPGARDLFGPTFVPRTDIIVDRDRWYSFELMVRANTPGQQDGRIAFWVDGALAADFPNLRLRSTDALKINYAMLSTYSSEVHSNKTLWYDDVVVATSYIGPMYTGVPIDPDGGVPQADGEVQDDDSGVNGGGGDGDGGCGCRAAVDRSGLPVLFVIWLVMIIIAFRLRRRRTR